jgi:hypothetical protein
MLLEKKHHCGGAIVGFDGTWAQNIIKKLFKNRSFPI